MVIATAFLLVVLRLCRTGSITVAPHAAENKSNRFDESS